MGNFLLNSGAPERHRLEHQTRRWATLLLGVALCNAGWLPLDAAEIEVRDSPTFTADRIAGEMLARQVCASCHLFPEPQVLDRKTWQDQILPRMEALLGVSPPDYSTSPEGELLRQLHIYPDKAVVEKAD